jgi:hypothetical protein
MTHVSNTDKGKKFFSFSKTTTPAAEPTQTPIKQVPAFFFGGKTAGL